MQKRGTETTGWLCGAAQFPEMAMRYHTVPHGQAVGTMRYDSSTMRDYIGALPEDEITYDPGLRKQIDEYHPNLRERVRRKYLENGPCQPRTFAFPMTSSRREKKDGGYEAFVKNGWNGFHRKERLKLHVGDVGGSHYQAMKKCDDLLQKRQHIDVAFHSVRETCKRDYLTRLNGSIDVARMLVKLGLPFLGYDESKESNNRGNFREFRDYTAEQNPSLRKAIGYQIIVEDVEIMK
ncbi:hypothetical protein OsJ_33830 [Oryza sativa Japonica Group]|uniref:DUF4371 domain-containing protein n=1 Tax=Oryza sativa subsp. japonica TaxID=39947 RepID=B9GAL5_ORYSJ|nr:hypothetical protein OsJ_33830 [Oryza sativa Japonica Group]